MSKLPKINQELCIGCGSCANLCPEVFKMAKDGKAEVVNPKGCEKCDCEMARENCPVEAISLE